MFFKILVSHLLGYMNIVVEGYFIERFMNSCISKKILLWNVKREKASILYANIGIKDFKRLKKIAKTTKCKVKIQEKKGLPFLIKRYQKRKLFFICLVLIFLAIFVLSNFIWNIEVTGNQKISQTEILELLEKQGLKIGSMKGNIDTKQVIQKVRLERDDIAWIGIELTGTNAIVEVVEAEEKPDMINPEEFCNIVADAEGIITEVKALNGIPQVKKGDTVKKGDILISGTIEGKYTEVSYVHSEGEVEAKIWYSEKTEVPYREQKIERTGLEEKRYGIKINNFQINFYKTLSNFEKYDTIIENKKLKLFSDFYLPITFVTKRNYETKVKDVTHSKEEATDIGIQELESKLKEQIGEDKQVVDKHVNVKEKEQGIEVELVYEVLEKIGTKEKIEV